MNSEGKANQKESIETDRLILVPFTYNHITAKYIGWLNDPVVVRFSEQRHFRHTYESCIKYIDSLHAANHKIWAIICKQGNFHIGNITTHIDKYNSIADIGILIGERDYWSKGYGFEAWRAVCDFAFHKLKLRKVTGGALSTNQAIIKIMKKTGMSEDGRRIQHYLFEGQIVDVIHMAMFNDQ